MKNLNFAPEGVLIHTPENRACLASAEALEQAMREQRTLEAEATLCDNRMRLHVALGSMEGIMEREECAWCRPGEQIKDIAVITRVGKPIAFKILRFGMENGVRVAYLSRRAAQSECAAALFGELCAGDLITARITHTEPYGAFADIGCGISALLSIDCISVSRISHPRERLCPGMLLTVAVKQIDRTLWRIFVTLKELLGTWLQNAAHFEQGQTVMGRVRSIETYGIFVELAPNLAGLAELRSSNGTPIRTAVGDLAAVYIKSILPERMKIKLVIVDSYPAPELPHPPQYFIDSTATEHIELWRYSPEECGKIIETRFE